MSMQWIITNIASIALKISLYQIVTNIDKVENFNLLIFPMSLCQLFQIYSGYLSEKYMKQNFEKAYNLAQNVKNMKAILDHIDEVVVVSRPTTTPGEDPGNDRPEEKSLILFMNEYFIKLA